MIAIQIEPSVGRCDSCHKFRNNMEWKVDEKVVCLDCYKTFKNQKLIKEVILSKELEPVKPVKPIKALPNKPRLSEPRVFNGLKAGTKKYAIYMAIKESEKALTTADLDELDICTKNFLFIVVRELEKSGKIVSQKSGRLFYYVDAEREELLPRNRRRKKRVSCKDIILDFINKSTTILIVEDVVNNLKLCKKTALRIVRLLEKENKVKLILDTKEQGNKFIFCDVSNEVLVGQLEDLVNTSKPARAKEELMKAGKEGLSTAGLMRKVGYNPRSGGAARHIQRLAKKWGCKTYRRGNNIVYYFESAEG